MYQENLFPFSYYNQIALFAKSNKIKVSDVAQSCGTIQYTRRIHQYSARSSYVEFENGSNVLKGSFSSVEAHILQDVI